MQIISILIFNASAERQQGNIVYGVQPGYSPYLLGRRTDRNETRQDVALNLSGTYDIRNTYENHTTLSFGYMFRQERRDVSRRDNLADSLSAFDFSLTRNIHEVFAKIQYEFNNSNIQFVNRSYFSNTAKNYVNLFPTLGAKWDLKRTWYLDFFDQLQPFLNISRSLREAPAIFGNQAVLSTQLNSQNFNRYFENREITWNNQISPETELKIRNWCTSQHVGFWKFVARLQLLQQLYFQSHHSCLERGHTGIVERCNCK